MDPSLLVEFGGIVSLCCVWIALLRTNIAKASVLFCSMVPTSALQNVIYYSQYNQTRAWPEGGTTDEIG